MCVACNSGRKRLQATAWDEENERPRARVANVYDSLTITPR